MEGRRPRSARCMGVGAAGPRTVGIKATLRVNVETLGPKPTAGEIPTHTHTPNTQTVSIWTQPNNFKMYICLRSRVTLDIYA